MNILVTGTGLVGCHAARELLSRGHGVALYDLAPKGEYIRRIAGDVPVVQGDIRDLPALLETMQAHRTETVFHSAYFFGGGSPARLSTGFNVNLDGAMAVAEAVRLSGARRLLFTSSFGIYQWTLPPRAPVTEDFPVAGDVFYRASKVACENLLRAFGSHYGLDIATLRLGQVYGLTHPGGGDRVSQVLHRLVTDALRGGPVALDVDLFDRNEYVYVKDVAQGVALACERPFKSRVFNIGSGALYTVEDVAQAFRAAFPGVGVRLGTGLDPGYSPRRPQPLDLTRARQELGYAPAFDLTAGLRDLAREMRQTGSYPPNPLPG